MSWLKLVGLFCFLVAAAVYCAAADRVARKRHAKHRASIDVPAIIHAIAAVETGHNWAAIGKLGERGRCQFMRATWQQYTDAPFDVWASRNSSVSWHVERAHLARILDAFERNGHDFDPALIAAAWRFGATNALRYRRADSSRRVANLYWEALGL